MAVKADRGTKRTCQNGACGARFYDLGRNPIVCPMCSTAYAVAAPVVPHPTAAEAAAQRRAASKKPDFPPPAPAGDVPEPEAEAEDALADVEGAEEPIAAGEETFLEEEQDEGGDVTAIIGGATEGEEEP